MAMILTDNKHYTDIADKLRSNLGSEDTYLPEEMSGKVDEVFEKGKQAEYDWFWDKYQNNGNRTDYYCAFSGSNWKDNVYNPKYPIKVLSGCNMLFYQNMYFTDTKVDIDMTAPTVTSIQSFNLFQGCSKLKTIRKLIVRTTQPWISSGVSTFDGCTSLENILIVKLDDNGVETLDRVITKSINLSMATKLTKESIENIMNALDNATTVTNPTASFSKTAVNKAFETSLGANDGVSSAEWDSLQSTKSNWTISLV